jgi:hypothetical protein
MSQPTNERGSIGIPSTRPDSTRRNDFAQLDSLDSFEIASSADPRLLAALTGKDAGAERAVALRTRRAVFNSVASKRTERAEGRRSMVIALLITGCLIFALAPTLWSGMEDMLGGDALTDLPGMVIALCMTLFAAVAAVLFLMQSDRSGGNDKQTIAFARSRRP